MRIFVGGCNGSGKTTVLNSESIGNLEVIHATTSFMQWLDIGEDYERLRKMPDQEREDRLFEFMTDLINSRDNFILDSHYFILVYGEFKKVIADWISEFDAYVLITAPTNVLLQRVESDSGRNRALFPEGLTSEEKLEMLTMYQETVRTQSKNLAKEYEKPYLEIENDGLLNEAVSQLRQFVVTLS